MKIYLIVSCQTKYTSFINTLIAGCTDFTCLEIIV
jgi:hypothetical protein